MNEQMAREILGDAISSDCGLYDLGIRIGWDKESDDITLDGSFTVEYLKAVIWWVENKK